MGCGLASFGTAEPLSHYGLRNPVHVTALLAHHFFVELVRQNRTVAWALVSEPGFSDFQVLRFRDFDVWQINLGNGFEISKKVTVFRGDPGQNGGF